ncbi:flagellar filament capping protein FliD [Arenivirga flava]|uniref:Flagellar hook-associated protein 2 n=1 Tax=Arenivirga flava TaxID=1930060 RepID=A0AA37UGU8_9MICO|nr:flagellar filament capping protein FliD [Arenivirga flava]GMA27851.1 flagellar hook-associated protein 2 [Arenivirga flava]
MAAIDGLASGLDTAALINSLIQLEANPQTLLKQKQVKVGTLISAYQTLNSTVANLATNAGKLTSAAKVDAAAATSSSTAVTATLGDGAASGTLKFTVDRLAQGQTAVTAKSAAWADASGLITIEIDGERHELTAASSSMSDIASAVNKAGLGISATRVAAGTDADGTALYRLQFASSETGEAARFSVYAGASFEHPAGAADLFAADGAAVVSEAQDAQLTLWPGTAAAQAVTSAGNTFADVLPGVTLAVTEASETPTTVTVSRDAKAVSAKVAGLVTNLGSTLSYITSNSRITSATDGGATTGGTLAGDSTARDTKNKLTTAFIAPIDGVSPSEYGITVDKAGVFSFDAAEFEAALAKDPQKTLAAVATLGARVEETAKGLSDPREGIITAKVTGQQSLSKSLTQRIEQWDVSLATRRATLEKTYATLEVTLSNLQSQGNWLAGQLATLPNLNAGSNR